MRALPALLASLLILAGCGREAGAAFLDSRTPPAIPPRAWAPDGWAWGIIRIEGAPEIRYGVAAPPGRPAGHVVFVTGYGESAEVYFETAHDLLQRGYAVWTLEPHGQGGSGRFGGRGDIGRSAGFDKDAAALRTLVEQVIRPARTDLVVAVAHGSGALPVLLALQGGLGRVDRVHLSHPDLTFEAPSQARRFTQIGLGQLRARGGPWRRPQGDLGRRTALPLAWQAANPDLRMGGPGWSWLDAEARAIRDAVSPEALARVDEPVRLWTSAGDRAAALLCTRLPDCSAATDHPRPAGHLADNDAREAWLAALLETVEGRPAAGEPHGE